MDVAQPEVISQITANLARG